MPKFVKKIWSSLRWPMKLITAAISIIGLLIASSKGISFLHTHFAQNQGPDVAKVMKAYTLPGAEDPIEKAYAQEELERLKRRGHLDDVLYPPQVASGPRPPEDSSFPSQEPAEGGQEK